MRALTDPVPASQTLDQYNFPWRASSHMDNAHRFHGRKSHVSLWHFLPSWKAQVCVSVTYCTHTWRGLNWQRFAQYPFSSKLFVVTLRGLCVWVKLRKRRSKNVDALSIWEILELNCVRGEKFLCNFRLETYFPTIHGLSQVLVSALWAGAKVWKRSRPDKTHPLSHTVKTHTRWSVSWLSRRKQKWNSLSLLWRSRAAHTALSTYL